MLNVAKLEQELKALRERTIEINRLIQEHEATIKLLRIEYEGLRGSLYGNDSGEIGAKRCEIADARLHNADLQSPRVVWLKDREGEYVVRKVTPKRIYVARIGSNITVQYTRDGRRTRQGAPIAIDVEATFR